MNKSNTKFSHILELTHNSSTMHELDYLPHFFMTAETACPYLPNRCERKLFTFLDSDDAMRLNNDLTHAGFRRNQNVAWRPACADCAACQSARVRVMDFIPSASQKRVIRRNRDLIATRHQPHATDEQFELFKTYLAARHAHRFTTSSNMNNMRKHHYQAMVEDAIGGTHIIEYRKDETLYACVLVDSLYDGHSLLYSFFNPDLSRRSLGTYVILEQIARTRAAQKSYLYLGYWVAQSPKMTYKQKFKPLEVLDEKGWGALNIHETQRS